MLEAGVTQIHVMQSSECITGVATPCLIFIININAQVRNRVNEILERLINMWHKKWVSEQIFAMDFN